MADRETLAKQDAEHLLAQPQFRRFLFRAIQMAGIFTATTDGSEGRHLAYHEGRRNLGLDILAEVAVAQIVPDPEGLLTLLQILREEAQQQTEEPKRDRRNHRNDRYAELHDGDDSDDDRAAADGS